MSTTREPSTTRASAEAPRPKLGRPRAVAAPANSGEPREEILTAAASLFAAEGYRQTSTKKVAEAVGLRQGSLFYYFPKKEDILKELLDRTVDGSIEFLARLQAHPAEPDVMLYAWIHRDLRTLTSPPGGLGRLAFLPEARTTRFAKFWDKHARLLEAYDRFIEAGMADRTFKAADVATTSRILCGLVEGAATWEPPTDILDEQWWRAVSDFALSSVLADTSRIDHVRDGALKLVSELDAED
jgi:AcrR family transcriptional regulator